MTDHALIDHNDFKRALGAELTVAHQRLGRRRKRRQRGAAALVATALVVLAVGAYSALESPQADAAAVIVVEQADGSRSVSFDPRASAAEVSDDLTKAKVAHTIRTFPTGPSRVGTITSLGFLDSPQRPKYEASTFEIPAGFTGRILLGIGVAAAPGESYASPTSPFAPGEPLADFDRPQNVTAVVETARARGLTVSVLSAQGQPVDVVAPGAVALTMAMVSSNTMQVRLEP